MGERKIPQRAYNDLPNLFNTLDAYLDLGSVNRGLVESCDRQTGRIFY